jgi:hypothetical protein
MGNFKLGDNIILSDDGIGKLMSEFQILREKIFKRVKKITKVKVDKNNIQTFYEDNSDSTDCYLIMDRFFRLATEEDIIKQNMKDMFIPYVEEDYEEG